MTSPPQRRRSPTPSMNWSLGDTGLRGCQPRPAVLKAGPTLNNQASDNNSRRSTGQSAPETPPSLDGATFQCEFPGCERSFQTTIGRGQHHRRMHKACYKEFSLLARREAKLSIPSVRAINQVLNHQPASTLPSPQGLGHSIYQPIPGPFRRHSLSTSTTYGANAGTEGDFSQSSAHNLQNIPRVNTTGYQAERLHNIVYDVGNSSTSAIFERLSRYRRDVFPLGSPHHRPAVATHQQQQTRRQARCREYATTRRHWRSNRCDVSRTSWEMSRMPSSHLEPRLSRGNRYHA